MITVNKKVKKAVVAVLSLILLGGAIAGIATAKSHAAGEKSQRKQVLQAVPAAGTYAKAPKIEDVEYDDEDREVSFDFYGRVQWRRPKVKITDKYGRSYVVRIHSKDRDDIEVKVKRLKYGAKYKYKISGVKVAGTSGYKTVRGSFTAYDD